MLINNKYTCICNGILTFFLCDAIDLIFASKDDSPTMNVFFANDRVRAKHFSTNSFPVPLIQHTYIHTCSNIIEMHKGKDKGKQRSEIPEQRSTKWRRRKIE